MVVTERTLDSILETFEISFFHYRLLLMCGLAFMADAMEVSLLSFMSACAGDEWNLSNAERASIIGVVFAGELLGSLFWGPFADKYGRRFSFMVACAMISLAGFLSGVSPSYPWLLFFRAIVGFGVGGLSVPFDLLAEFLPAKQRGPFLINIQYFWTFGSLLIAGVAWVSLSQDGWRVLTYITAAPVTVASLVAVFYLPESPRWLMVKGRYEEAEAIVKQTAELCGVELGPFKLVQDNPDVKEVVKDASYLDLVRSPEGRRISFPLWVVWLCFGFTYYGIILFVSRLYASSSADDDSTCHFDFQSVFINSSSELLGVLVAANIIDWGGRTRTQAGLYLLGGATVCLMGIPMQAVALTVVGMIARASIMGASCGTWVATPELYPTEMRASGHSLCNSVARVGGFCAPYFVISDLSIVTVGIVLGVANAIASFAANMLPETAGLGLDEGVRVVRVLSSDQYRKSRSSMDSPSFLQSATRSFLATETDKKQVPVVGHREFDDVTSPLPLPNRQ